MRPICVFTEFCGFGDLRGYLTKRAEEKQALNVTDAVHLLHDVAAGMQFLHSAAPPVIHRDLKSPNILLVETPESLAGKAHLSPLEREQSPMAKVADFGLSTRTSLPVKGRLVDNPLWLAPEVLRSEPYSSAADVYAFGIIMFEVLTLRLPYATTEYSFMYQLEDMIVAGSRPEIPPDTSPVLARLMAKCWAAVTTERPEFDEIVGTLAALRTRLCGLPEGSLSGAAAQVHTSAVVEDVRFNRRLGSKASPGKAGTGEEEGEEEDFMRMSPRSGDEDEEEGEGAFLYCPRYGDDEDEEEVEATAKKKTVAGRTRSAANVRHSQYAILRQGIFGNGDQEMEAAVDEFGYEEGEEPAPDLVAEDIDDVPEEERKKWEAAAAENDLVKIVTGRLRSRSELEAMKNNRHAEEATEDSGNSAN
mmetsp:Transcript_16260/g.63394  ORF Transcript_16260/g.63394 Transcript_16260/m.63394 type:complete len:418 (+) Transcript_16260:1-1254(+)